LGNFIRVVLELVDRNSLGLFNSDIVSVQVGFTLNTLTKFILSLQQNLNLIFITNWFLV